MVLYEKVVSLEQMYSWGLATRYTTEEDTKLTNLNMYVRTEDDGGGGGQPKTSSCRIKHGQEDPAAWGLFTEEAGRQLCGLAEGL